MSVKTLRLHPCGTADYVHEIVDFGDSGYLRHRIYLPDGMVWTEAFVHPDQNYSPVWPHGMKEGNAAIRLVTVTTDMMAGASI